MYGFQRVHVGKPNRVPSFSSDRRYRPRIVKNAHGLFSISHTTGENRGAFKHPLFARNRPDLVQTMKRVADVELVHRAKPTGGGEKDGRVSGNT